MFSITCLLKLWLLFSLVSTTLAQTYTLPGVYGVISPRDHPPTTLSTSCMVRSLSSPLWIVHLFRYNLSQNSVSFKLENTMDKTTIECSGSYGRRGRCGVGDSRALFTFGGSKNFLEVKQEWNCDDLSPGKSLVSSSFLYRIT